MGQQNALRENARSNVRTFVVIDAEKYGHPSPVYVSSADGSQLSDDDTIALLLLTYFGEFSTR